MQTTLKKSYADALVASGLVDDFPDYTALDPLPRRYAEGQHICHRGDKADRLWVIVSGSVAVRDDARTLYVRSQPSVVGELNLLSEEGYRWYDLVANESMVELLTIRREAIEHCPHPQTLWRNIARIIALKLKSATIQTASLLEQVQDDAHILRAYTNEYALSRRLISGSRFLTDHRVETAIVWFSDIVNFTRSVLDLPPARTADLVQRFFNAQAEAIERHDGYIDKFMGDGLMAFWVVSSADRRSCAGDCEAALAAAEEAVEAVAHIHVGNLPLELRVGLHVGDVLSGDFGSAQRHQFTLIGDAVNKAAQLEQIHDFEVADGDGLGPVRISAEFRDRLTERTGRRYGRQGRATTRKLGTLDFFSASEPSAGVSAGPTQ